MKKHLIKLLIPLTILTGIISLAVTQSSFYRKVGQSQRLISNVYSKIFAKELSKENIKTTFPIKVSKPMSVDLLVESIGNCQIIKAYLRTAPLNNPPKNGIRGLGVTQPKFALVQFQMN